MNCHFSSIQDDSARNGDGRAEEADQAGYCLKLAIVYCLLLCHFIESVASMSTVRLVWITVSVPQLCFYVNMSILNSWSICVLIISVMSFVSFSPISSFVYWACNMRVERAGGGNAVKFHNWAGRIDQDDDRQAADDAPVRAFEDRQSGDNRGQAANDGRCSSHHRYRLSWGRRRLKSKGAKNAVSRYQTTHWDVLFACFLLAVSTYVEIRIIDCFYCRMYICSF